MKQSLFCKTISVLLTISSLLSSVSCGKKSSEKSKKITSEDPWFDVQNYSIETDLNTCGKEIDYRQQKLAGADDKYIVVFSYGDYIRPDNIGNNSSDYSYFLVTVIDRNTGDRLNTINLNQYLSGNGFVKDVQYINGRITSTVYMEEDYFGYTIEIDTDILTGEKLEERKITDSEGSYFEKSKFQVGNYVVLTKFVFGEAPSPESFVKMSISSSEGKEYHVKLQKEHIDLNYIPIILPLDDEKLLVPFTQTSNNNPVYFEVDIKAEKAVEVDRKDYDWIDFKMITNGFGSKDGKVYFSSSVGVFRIDMKNKKIEEFFNYNNCSVNKESISNNEIIDCNNNNMVLLGGRSSSFCLEEDTSKVVIDIYFITKASENPNAGKTILELYATNGYVDQTTSKAIIDFNMMNKDYYIEIVDRYVAELSINYLPTDNHDDVESTLLRANLSLNDKLAMDIMNGEGPDILIINGDIGRLYNPSYLVDLNVYIDTLDPEKYFNNVVEAAKTDGKLYQLPITFGIEGIHTDSKYAGASGKGFTTREYKDFLCGPLNGYDLNQTGQAVYFATLFNAMSDRFIIKGKADFSCPEFNELADFVKNNVREKAALVNDSYVESTNEMAGQNDRIARLTTCIGPIRYFAEVNELQGAKAILGIPSADGRGPMIRSTLSVAVSAQAVNIEACVDFIKLLLADEIQYDMAKSGYFTLSREAYRKCGRLVLKYCNGPRGNDEFGYGIYGDNYEPIKNRIIFTEDDLKELEKTILECSHFDSVDSSINIILIEEMPSYFLGQKKLSEVVKIAQDRVQKVLDERG